jgi:transcriptional regulator with XRE-family HTH domain
MRESPLSAVSLRLSAALRTKRTEKGISQAALADHAGLSRTCIANIELGRQECGLQTFVDLAIALGVEPADLLKQIWQGPSTDDAFALKILRKADVS